MALRTRGEARTGPVNGGSRRPSSRVLLRIRTRRDAAPVEAGWAAGSPESGRVSFPLSTH